MRITALTMIEIQIKNIVKIKIISNEIYGWFLWSIFSFNDQQKKLMLLFVDIFNLKNKLKVHAVDWNDGSTSVNIWISFWSANSKLKKKIWSF